MVPQISFIVLVQHEIEAPLWPPPAGHTYDRVRDADARARELVHTVSGTGAVHVREYEVGAGWQRGVDRMVLRKRGRSVIEVSP